ncbi:MAG TPA: YciI family protein [Jiangellales bacterium]|nr:YciI family protein [Jiangellales bacterium]
MKYMLLTYGPAEVWDTDSYTDEGREQMREMVAFMQQLNDDLRASGELLAAEGLTGPQDARTVRWIDDEAVTTDGPYAESKEFLAGYWVVDVPSLERAAEIAARVVRYVKAPIEIRPVGEAPEL